MYVCKVRFVLMVQCVRIKVRFVLIAKGTFCTYFKNNLIKTCIVGVYYVPLYKPNEIGRFTFYNTLQILI